MLEQSALFLIGGAEQKPLPGVDRRDPGHRQPPLMKVVDEPEEGDAAPEIPRGQLAFGKTQLELEDGAPAPVQLSLLPDPPPWELPENSSPAQPKGRLARKRARRGQIPGQTSLF